ncbi:MAG: hypothetical protein HFF17_05300 [Oscillospiraceae bacterium]|nr:hypothetical protein [Oscillospiraceae bacterium]
MRKALLPLALALLLAACASAEPAAPAQNAEPAAAMENVPAEPSQPPEAPAQTTPAPAVPETTTPAPEASAAGVDAMAIALEAAGLTEADIRAPLVESDTEDGTAVFEVEFYVPSQRMEYEFEIDARTGAVREQKSEAKGLADAGDATVLPEADILARILEKVPGASEQDVALYLERDDGTLVYEGHVRYDGMEYDFEIDPWKGTILEWESDRIH